MSSFIKFKERQNRRKKYKLHFTNYEFTKQWFSILDTILVELKNYKMDTDIEIIKKKVRKLLIGDDKNRSILDKIDKMDTDKVEKSDSVENYIEKHITIYKEEYHRTYENVNILYKLYMTSEEFIRWLVLHYPDKIIWDYLSKNETDFAVEYLIKNPKEIHIRHFEKNKNKIAIDYMKKTDLYKLHEPDEVFFIVTADGYGDKCLAFEEYLKPHDTCILSMWRLYEFRQLNWLPLSGLIID